MSNSRVIISLRVYGLYRMHYRRVVAPAEISADLFQAVPCVPSGQPHSSLAGQRNGPKRKARLNLPDQSLISELIVRADVREQARIEASATLLDTVEGGYDDLGFPNRPDTGNGDSHGGGTSDHLSR